VALTAAPLFIDYVKALADERLSVVSPDPGGTKRADLFREALQAALRRPVGKGFADKRRSAGVVSGDLFVGEVEDTTALVIDDLISTGGTLVRAAHAARKSGAKRVIALVTHGLFAAGAETALLDPAIDRLVVTDSVPLAIPGGQAVRAKLDVIAVAPLLAECIRRIHAGDMLSDLLVF
jgi:ribose-phosphate pyrophosphokinase